MSANLPLVSMVMPVFNGAAFIAEAIDSVLAQTYPHIETIVVDDGSTDATLAVLAPYGARIKIISQRNAGPAAARNRGLLEARGEFIAFLDADDFWLAEKVRRQVDHLLAHPETGVVYTRWMVWKPGTPRPEVAAIAAFDAQHADVQLVRGSFYLSLLLDCVLLTSSVVMRRSVIDRVGAFDPTLLRGQDYDYWLRASVLTEIRKLEETLTLYRVEGSNIMAKFPKENYGVRVLEKAVAAHGLRDARTGATLDAAPFKARLAREWMHFGRYHLSLGDLPRARAAFAAALRHQPLHFRYLEYLAFACLRPALPRRFVVWLGLD